MPRLLALASGSYPVPGQAYSASDPAKRVLVTVAKRKMRGAGIGVNLSAQGQGEFQYRKNRLEPWTKLWDRAALKFRTVIVYQCLDTIFR